MTISLWEIYWLLCISEIINYDYHHKANTKTIRPGKKASTFFFSLHEPEDVT